MVSPDDPDRDLVEKRADYAEAGIPEYWIVDPRDETITVLALEGGTYRDLGVFGSGDTARSRVLDGFAADVRSVFDAPSRMREMQDPGSRVLDGFAADVRSVFDAPKPDA